MAYKSNHNIVYSCQYHVVWCPKYRRRVLTSEVEERLKVILHEVAQERQAEIIELAIMPDHVHLLVEVDPQFGIHRLIRLMKGRSSHHLRQEFPWLKSRLPTLWTNSYFVSTVGGAPLAVIKQYIENQKNV
jgi:putative transposase